MSNLSQTAANKDYLKKKDIDLTIKLVGQHDLGLFSGRGSPFLPKGVR